MDDTFHGKGHCHGSGPCSYPSPSHLQLHGRLLGVVRQQPPPRRPGLRSSTIRSDPATEFNECLNAVYLRVKLTREEEVEDSIVFLDVQLTRLPNGRITTHIYRKPSNTNTIMEPHSCQPPNTITSTFNSEICCATRLCTFHLSPKKRFASP
jgi:hypothetical protein